MRRITYYGIATLVVGGLLWAVAEFVSPGGYWLSDLVNRPFDTITATFAGVIGLGALIALPILLYSLVHQCCNEHGEEKNGGTPQE